MQENAEENVVFDNAGPNLQPPQGDGGVGGQAPPGEGEPPDGTVNADDGTVVDDSGPPPPSGIKALLLDGGKRKKILIAIGIFILIIIIIVIFLPRNQAPKEVTLTWWGLWEEAATMQPLIDDFERQNPNIKINYIKQDPERYRDTLLTRISKGAGPDIFRYHNSWTQTLTGTLTPLPASVISVENFTTQYYPVIQKDLILNGAIYGIPLGIDSIALFVNTDLLTKAGLAVPQDWNQFVSAAKKLTERDPETNEIKIAGASLGTYHNVNHAADIISVMFLQQGVEPIKIAAAQDNMTAALSFYTAFGKGGDAVWGSSMENSLLEFARGNAAMYFGFSWNIFAIDQTNTDKKINYEIHPVPSLIEGRPVTVASYWVEGVSSQSKNQKESMLFMKYLTQKETLQKFYTEASKTRLFGEPYPRVDMAEELKDNPMIYPFIANLDVAGSSYFASSTYDGDTGLNSRANTYLENAVTGITNGKSTPAAETKKIQLGVLKILLENGFK